MMQVRTRKYQVSKEYSTLDDFVLSIPENFPKIGAILQNNRNVIKRVSTEEGTFVIKHFKGMYFFNRLAYSSIRKSKAERSFIYSELLHKKCIATPANVAWIDCYQWGILTRSYYVNVFSHHHTFRQLLERHIHLGEEAEKVSLLLQLACFAFNLHHAAVYHQDFSPTNILVENINNEFHFSLVDLNRIRFIKPSYRKGLQNFANIGCSEDDMNIVITEYARLSGQSKDISIHLFWKDRKQRRVLRKIRRTIREYTLKPLENLFLKAKII